jgi:hypothetical protein
MKYFVSSNLSVGLFDTNLLDGDHNSLIPLQAWAWVYRSQIVFKHVGERKWYFIRYYSFYLHVIFVSKLMMDRVVKHSCSLGIDL